MKTDLLSHTIWTFYFDLGSPKIVQLLLRSGFGADLANGDNIMNSPFMLALQKGDSYGKKHQIDTTLLAL